MRIITAIVFSLVGYLYAQTAHAEQTNKTAQPPKFDIKHFDSSRNNLNGYLGHDAKQIFRSLIKRPKKNEFETTNSFLEKLRQWEEKPLYAHVHMGDTLAFVAPADLLSPSYDADTETMTVGLSNAESTSSQFGGTVKIPFLALFQKRNTVLKSGITRMGVKFNFEEIKSYAFGIYLPNTIPSYRWRLNLSIGDAKKLKKLGSLVLIGKLTSPYTLEDYGSESASLSAPFDIKARTEGLALSLEEIWITNQDGGVVTRININDYQKALDENELVQVMELVQSKLKSEKNISFKYVKQTSPQVFCGVVSHNDIEETFYFSNINGLYLDSTHEKLATKFCESRGWNTRMAH